LFIPFKKDEKKSINSQGEAKEQKIKKGTEQILAICFYFYNSPIRCRPDKFVMFDWMAGFR